MPTAISPLKTLIESVRWPDGQRQVLTSTSPNRTTNQGGKGTVPSYSSQPSHFSVSQDFDDQHCAQCRQAEFLPYEGRSLRDFQSEDHHVRRDSELQEALESANRTVLPGTMRRTSRATVRLLLEPRRFSDRAAKSASGFKFMALNTGKKIVRRLDHYSTSRHRASLVSCIRQRSTRATTFTDRHGRLIGDIDIPKADSDEANDVQFPGGGPQ
jgi:hypothetical protein